MNIVKILLVDDLKDNLLALEGLLDREDIEILKASSGTEALDLMMTHEFAVALIDVQMPSMSGFELAELMRGTNMTKSIPIIFVTATATHQNFSFKGYESGAVDFLLKPLDTHAVKSKVNIFIELYSQKKELKKTQASLEKAVQIRDEFMSIASHELKSPLTAMMLHVQMRKRQLKNDPTFSFTTVELNKMLNTDERQIKRLTHLIDDMLDVSRISSGHLAMNLEKFDLYELITDLVERSTEQLLVAGCQIKIEMSEPSIVSWDRFRIEQVILNLLTNAMRYGAGQPILITASISPNTAEIMVQDQGRGIAKADINRIFQKFERAVSNTEITGLGLGLYIVKQIVEAHNGNIRVESEIGNGSTFIVELPLNCVKKQITKPTHFALPPELPGV